MQEWEVSVKNNLCIYLLKMARLSLSGRGWQRWKMEKIRVFLFAVLKATLLLGFGLRVSAQPNADKYPTSHFFTV